MGEDKRPCWLCGEALEEATHRAVEILYGAGHGGMIPVDRNRLLRAIEGAESIDPDAAYDEIGRRAMLDVLGIPSFAYLVAAYLHYEHFCECREG